MSTQASPAGPISWVRSSLLTDPLSCQLRSSFLAGFHSFANSQLCSYIPSLKVLREKLVGHSETPGQWHTCAQLPAHSALAHSPGASALQLETAQLLQPHVGQTQPPLSLASSPEEQTRGTPLNRASMTRVLVTSFSLKKRFTSPCAMAFLSLAVWLAQYALKLAVVSFMCSRLSRFSSTKRRQIPSTLVRYTRTSSRRY
ncbi:MAG: hypothetical protein FRX49_01833 [Trebouxia sp. A1-2]|nr:MAG: hypothetical protein FRX49_01833 [Trebouxia sp. A1-2]